MNTYRLLISEQIGYYVDVEAESEEEAIEDYYNNSGHPYGEKVIENYVVEVEKY
jgi:hypothetical protein